MEQKVAPWIAKAIKRIMIRHVADPQRVDILGQVTDVSLGTAMGRHWRMVAEVCAIEMYGASLLMADKRRKQLPSQTHKMAKAF